MRETRRVFFMTMPANSTSSSATSGKAEPGGD